MSTAEQGTEQWLQDRVGCVTASCMNDVFAKDRSGKGEGTTRKNYRTKLLIERLSGVRCDRGYKSKSMMDGNDLEPLARGAYEYLTGRMVYKVGFKEHPTITWYGCSADGLVEDEGGLEIKCGIPATHIAWFKEGVIPSEHRKQMVSGLSCHPERKWWDFVSHCPELPEDMQTLIVRLVRDGKEIATVEDEVEKINREIAAEIEELKEIAERRKALHV